ncbi:MAG: Nif3-like dinuclear metal center hexameric protein [Evtepia sp.]|uniref:Nif3-like dinuclear metal center hexameric protein n=1 Tax=Evtepia sp. TaxID=2773933 RepID=UPI002A75C791|nr:Nif3-like dinuclear metal center hexameric protein [Evtepia sp.]MDY3014527.1 Nif3-like dinuclear metal center hexameric protein [Evtepia sp.]
MTTVKEIYQYLDQKAPFRYQMGFDNAGFLVGRGDAPVQGVLVALDITPAVIQEAAEKDCSLIVAHHPVIWGQIGQVTDETSTGRKILALIEGKLSAICAHTNLDSVEGGVNTELARLVGLKDSVPLEEDGVDEGGRPYGIGRVGELEGGPLSLGAFADRVKEALSLEGIRALDAGVPVRRVAVGGGACGSMLSQVKAMRCDTFLTSDLKHDLYLEARELGVNLLDAGHYSTETVVCPVLAQWLREAFPQVKVEISTSQREVFSYL